jgi:hypothetical protein
MERKGYRETLDFLADLFPDRAALSVAETAKALGAAPNTVYNMTMRVRNPLPFKKMGGKKIIPIPLLARWMCGEEIRSYIR